MRIDPVKYKEKEIEEEFAPADNVKRKAAILLAFLIVSAFFVKILFF